MANTTKDTIIRHVLHLVESTDPQQISMRQIAALAGVQQSVIYHHFASKEALLDAALSSAQQQIRGALMALPPEPDISRLLHQRIKYQLDNGHLIIPMLRYFMAFKNKKPDQPGTFIPPQAYMHIKQVIVAGVEKGIYTSPDIDSDAKVIVHAINGFVMEYYPIKEGDQERLISSIQSFVERALRKKGGDM